MTGRVLLLTPSRGLGGGIERYAGTVEWALTAQHVEHLRVDLRTSEQSPAAAAYPQMLARAGSYLRQSGVPPRLVVLHRALLPLAALLAARYPAAGISCICHGSDVWASRRGPRRLAENYLLGRPRVRVIAVSSFTAGALAGHCRSAVLPPGLSRPWFDTLAREAAENQAGLAADTHAAGANAGLELVTAFRLSDWRDKGLPQLLAAVTSLGRPDVRVTVCGSGEPSGELLRLMSNYDFCTLRPGLTDRQFARQLAAADLFVLATRTRPGPPASGEGFGLVLLEAQLAGTPVVAPAYGGSHDAFVNRVTGAAPADESVTALVDVLGELLKDPRRLAGMGSRAASWVSECFAPDDYAAQVLAKLL